MKNKILIGIVSLMFLSTTSNVFAQIPVAKPFGGPILFTYECACSGGWLVTVFDQSLKVPTPLTYQFGLSMLRPNYNIFTPGVQTLGSYIPGGWCQMTSTTCLGGFPTIGTITPPPLPGIGTSLVPSL